MLLGNSANASGMIYPSYLAGISQPVRRLRGFRGLGQFDPGSIATIVSAGSSFISSLTSSGAKDNNTLIAAQNRAGSDLAAISSQFVNLKNAAELSPQIIGQFIKAFQLVGQNFATYASSLTNDQSRANAGVNTINSVVQAGVNSMTSDSMSLFGVGPDMSGASITTPVPAGTGGVSVPTGVSPSGTPTYTTIPVSTAGIASLSQLTSSPYFPYIAIGLVAYLLLTRK